MEWMTASAFLRIWRIVATPKQGTDLMAEFAKACPSAPRFNRAVEKWAARDLVDSYGVDLCKQAMLWYASTAVAPTWKGFVYGADKCVKESSMYKQDLVKRKSNRKVAMEWRTS